MYAESNDTITLTLGDLEGQRQGHSDLEVLYLVKEPGLGPYFTMKH